MTDWIENGVHVWGYNTVQNIYNIGDIVRLWYYDNYVYSSYTVASSTVLTQYAVEGSNWLSKIIGRRYTRINPTGYREIELYSNDEHAATPVGTVITLSQSWTDFDEIVFMPEYYESDSQIYYYDSMSVKVSFLTSLQGRITIPMMVSSSQNSFIYINKETSTAFRVAGLSQSLIAHVYKIIGIKY